EQRLMVLVGINIVECRRLRPTYLTGGWPNLKGSASLRWRWPDNSSDRRCLSRTMTPPIEHHDETAQKSTRTLMAGGSLPPPSRHW
ncbi:MAG TPA: hypothetical protein PLS55_07625, partial [Thermogutta sp.]|nr:hypothetical protein [Thermogutta sp.]